MRNVQKIDKGKIKVTDRELTRKTRGWGEGNIKRKKKKSKFKKIPGK